MLYIDPESCIDCGACLPECPVQAIYQDVDVPADQVEFIALNAEMSQVCPPIVERQPPLVPRPSSQ